MNTEYYTAEEAMRELKKPRSTFFKEVENGLIPSEIETGRQRGRRYPKTAIDILAKRLHRPKGKDRGPTHLIFSPSSVADLWSEVQIGTELYGADDIVSFDTLLEWRDANDEMFMNLKDQGQVVGYSSLMPLDENTLMPLLQDKIREQDIPLKSIKQWTDPQLSVYVATVTIKPSGKQQQDKERGRFLIRQTVKWALSLNRQFNIKNWYGIGATKEGQHLFESLGFKEITSLYDGERKGYQIEDIKQPVKLINGLLAEMDRKPKLTAELTAETADHNGQSRTTVNKQPSKTRSNANSH